MQAEIARAPPDPCFGSVSIGNLRPYEGADLRSRTVKLKLSHEPILGIGCAQASSFDHLIGKREHYRRGRVTQRLIGLLIYGKIEFGRAPGREDCSVSYPLNSPSK